MKNEKEKYYGILLNDKIPKLDNKKNKFDKKVKVCFLGKAYLLEKNDKDEIERIEIENNYELNKERHYEIEFINVENERYLIEVSIESSYFFLIIWLFLLGFIIGLALCSRPNTAGNTPLARFLDYINWSVIGINISEDDEMPEDQYEFDVSFKNLSSDDISLSGTVSSKAVVRNKIAPGVSGSFAIIVSTKNSTVDMKYNVNFQDVTNEKPHHMSFKIRGYDKEYSSLQELQKELIGLIKKKSKKTIIIDWMWIYESGDNESAINESDLIDTNEGKILQSYKFKILVNGEEEI